MGEVMLLIEPFAKI